MPSWRVSSVSVALRQLSARAASWHAMWAGVEWSVPSCAAGDATWHTTGSALEPYAGDRTEK